MSYTAEPEYLSSPSALENPFLDFLSAGPSKEAATKPQLAIGSKETAAVKEAQELLGVKVDGIFGTKTKQAVIDYQKANGFPATGVIDSATWTALLGGSSPAKQANTAKTITDVSNIASGLISSFGPQPKAPTSVATTAWTTEPEPGAPLPWGWVIGVAAVLGGLGAAAYYFTRD
jgi:peptidoglycan hydrolase-like protein with peptidoglycan-binding domain